MCKKRTNNLPVLGTRSTTTISKMAGYYANLIENYTINEFGSCAYVAMSMLLSYYDSFCYDGIIPQWYSDDETLMGYEETGTLTNSPGVYECFGLNDYLRSNATNDVYYDICRYAYLNNNENFETKLVDIAFRYGYVTRVFFVNNANATLGVSFEIAVDFLKFYLKTHIYSDMIVNIYGLTNNGITEYIEYNAFKNFAINVIQSGNPIMAAVTQNGCGHMLIIYDYDVATDTFYFHTGQKTNNYTHYSLNNYDKIVSALYLTLPNRMKQESDNYYINGQYCCGCSNLVSY